MPAFNFGVWPGEVPGSEYRAFFISALDPALLDLAELILSGEEARVYNVGLSFSAEAAVCLGRSTWQDASARPGQIPFPTDCLTCSIRAVLRDFIRGEAARGGGSSVFLLPAGIELAHLMPGLHEDLGPAEVHLGGVAHLIEASGAAEVLLRHQTLADIYQRASDTGQLPSEHDWRGAILRHDTERCAAEVHVSNLSYADVTVIYAPADGDDEGGLGGAEAGSGHLARESAGSTEAGLRAQVALIEHLVPGDCLVVPGLDHPLLEILGQLEHNPSAALERAHPAGAQAWGGGALEAAENASAPSHSKVGRGEAWTLDLYSERPFHPERLRALAASLAVENCLVRGCFWLPSRPMEIFVWESYDGVASIAQAGPWLGSGEQAHCHLIVIGMGDPHRQQEIAHSFSQILVQEAEMAQALSWVGAPDGLDDWIGEEMA